MMRTQRQILNRLRYRAPRDPTGYEWTMYVDYLDFDNALEAMPNFTKEDWQPGHDFVMSMPVEQIMVKYLDDMWIWLLEGRKIAVHRGLQHYVAWFWLNGDTKFANMIDDYLMHIRRGDSQYLDSGIIKLIENKLGVETSA